MKLKVKINNKVIDLTLIEEISTDGNIFNITYNNGRHIEFLPEKAKEKIVFRGTNQEVSDFIKGKMATNPDLTQSNYGEHFFAVKNGIENKYQMFDLIDVKDMAIEREKQSDKLQDMFLKLEKLWNVYTEQSINEL